MTPKLAGVVFAQLTRDGFDARARMQTDGPLEGQAIVELYPDRTITKERFEDLFRYADENALEISFGKVRRRVVVLS